MDEVVRDIDSMLNGKSANYVEIEKLFQECTTLGCTDAASKCKKILDDMNSSRRSCLQQLHCIANEARFARDYSQFCYYDGYAPSSMPRHECEEPFMKSESAFRKEFISTVVSTAAENAAKRLQGAHDWKRKLARCAKALNPQCCNKNGDFKSDTAKAPRRWLVKRILLAVQSLVNSAESGQHAAVNLFAIEPIVVPSNYCTTTRGFQVEPFAAGRYRLPAGDQYRFTWHHDQFCSQDENIFTVRAQYNCFCCFVHENYGTIQLRQLYCALLTRKKTPIKKYAALTDGVTFRFIRTTLQCDRPTEECAHFNIRSELAQLIEFGTNFVLAALKPCAEPVDSTMPHIVALKSRVEKVLAFDENRVIKLQHDNDSHYVLKFSAQNMFDFNKEPSIHFAAEVATIKALAANPNSFYNKPELCSSIVKQILVENKATTLIVSEFSGKSLFSFCFCKCVSEWKHTVQRDIASALNHLHALSYVFVDLHPGNIVCRETGGERQAKLVDLESLTALTESEIKCRMLGSFMPPGRPLKPCIDNDFASLKLVLAWMDNTHRYRQIECNDYFCSSERDCVKRLIVT